ncbi:MAG TPA: NAD(P)H-dependent oxidoreductase [Pyrinomonadaceae bacterium]|nr:NAD(P)H-dependent oxidoreductase [Chloracidobacterium sp.]HBE83439.1 NADPH-dependent FMN reductase [Blastocatellia bacterium]HRJ89614.1 NAD(P)H-dependent oxidoreductase [Pyrinomonadaceae bacterium]HRK49575.1 NAD(P)H-dependent oxidoreductase [Pyrinomonadaceae bacterium]
MGDTIKILGISGSLRKGSYNTNALRAAAGLAPEGVEIEIYDLSGIPEFVQDQEPSAKVIEFKQKIREADAILISSPEYNYSVPGVLKNAIDWASRPYGDSAWEGKPAAIMGASTGGIGTARMQYHLRQIMVFLNMFPLNRPEVMISTCADKFDAEGVLTDEKTKEIIGKMLAALADWTRKLK